MDDQLRQKLAKAASHAIMMIEGGIEDVPYKEIGQVALDGVLSAIAASGYVIRPATPAEDQITVA